MLGTASVAGALLLVVARGWAVAHLQGGRYPLSAAPVDAAALWLLGAAILGVDKGLIVLGRRAFPNADRRSRTALTAVRLVLLLVVCGPMALAAMQLHPQRVAHGVTPADVGLEATRVWFESDGLRLAGWWIPGGPGRPVVVVAHGLGANCDQSLVPAILLAREGFGTLVFDFRAHGESAGFVSTLGEREARDVKAAHDWVLRNHPGVPVHALGLSMGASAVLRAAAGFGIFERVVADSSYARLEHVARQRRLRLLGPLAGLVWQEVRFWARLLAGFDPARHQPEDALRRWGDRPLLLVHGKADSLIPWTQSLVLERAARGRAAVWLLEGVEHTAAMAEPEYGRRVAAFLDGCPTGCTRPRSPTPAGTSGPSPSPRTP